MISSFQFDIGEKTGSGTVESISGFYRAKGKCPYCNKEYKAGYSPGDKRTKGEVIASVKFNVNRHFKKSHK